MLDDSTVRRTSYAFIEVVMKGVAQSQNNLFTSFVSLDSRDLSQAQNRDGTSASGN